jgi:hypothetical protein
VRFRLGLAWIRPVKPARCSVVPRRFHEGSTKVPRRFHDGLHAWLPPNRPRYTPAILAALRSTATTKSTPSAEKEDAAALVADEVNVEALAFASFEGDGGLYGKGHRFMLDIEKTTAHGRW